LKMTSTATTCVTPAAIRKFVERASERSRTLRKIQTLSEPRNALAA
jgi:hypothetical protein